MKDLEIQELATTLSLDISNIGKIQNNVHYITFNDKEYLLKTSSQKRFIKLRNILRYRHNKFINETYIYEFLSKQNSTHFRFPQLLDTDCCSYILYEFIDGNDGWDRHNISTESFMNNLVEFNLLQYTDKKPWYYKLMEFLNKKIPNKIFFWSIKLIRQPQDILYWSKCISLLIRKAIFVKSEETTLLVHSDLFFHNNMISTKDSSLYFLDFEYTHNDSKWFLIDIFDVSFNLTSLKMDCPTLEMYMLTLSKTIDANMCISYLQKQTRIILLRKCLGVLNTSSNTTELKNRNHHFICHVILSDQAYAQWYDTTIQPVVESILNRNQ